MFFKEIQKPVCGTIFHYAGCALCPHNCHVPSLTPEEKVARPSLTYKSKHQHSCFMAPIDCSRHRYYPEIVCPKEEKITLREATPLQV